MTVGKGPIERERWRIQEREEMSKQCHSTVGEKRDKKEPSRGG